MSHRRCTCSYESVNTATIDPPDLVLDPWCPEHGKDPDQEYERQRDDALWDKQCGYDALEERDMDFEDWGRKP